MHFSFLRRSFFLLVVCASFLWSFFAIAAPQQGLLSLSRTDSPPKIDGVLDDPLWQVSTKLGPFMLVSHGGSATEQTTAQFSYDRQFLYLAVKAEAFCLHPATNQPHLLQKNVTANDQDATLNDDCIVFIISHGDQEQVMYDFFINANGAVLDARGQGPNFWGTRDITWNSGIKCQTQIEAGYWTVEAAIPLASLGLAENRPDNCRFLIGRIEKRSNERSSWQDMRQAFHIADDWSQLVFHDQAPELSGLALPRFRSSQNESTLSLARSWPAVLHWEQQLHRQNGVVQSSQVIIPAGAAAQTWKLSVTLADQEQFAFQQVLQSEAGQLFFATPRYQVKPIFTDLVCLDVFRSLRLNGQEFKSSGMALRPGINRLEAAATPGQQLRFAIGDHQFALDDTWKQEQGMAHKTIFFEQTVLWPNWKADALRLAPGQAQQLLFWNNGLPEVNLKDGYKLILEVPPQCEIIGASGYYKLNTVEVAETKPAADGYRKYEIRFPSITRYTDTTRKETHRWCAVMLVPGKDWDGKGNLRFYAATNDDYAQEIPQLVTLKATPPVNGRQPQKILFQLWIGWLRNMDDIDLREKTFASFLPAGFNEAGSPGGTGLRKFSLINLKSWNVDLKEWLEQGEEYRLLTVDGKRHKEYPCSGRALYTPAGQEAMIRVAKAWQQKNQVDHCNLDFEGSIWNNELTCFCGFCLEQFAQHHQLATIPTVEQLREKYEQQWTAWMNQKMADFTMLLQKGVKEVKPDVVFSVYTGYQGEFTKSRYGVDWELLAGKIDYGMCGYGYNRELLQATKDAIFPSPMVSGVILHPYVSDDNTYPSHWSQATILLHLLMARGGVLFYNYPTMDGLSFYNIGEITRFVAEHEDLILNGKRVESEFPLLQGPTGDHYQVLRHNNQTVIMLMNPGRNPSKYQLNQQAPAITGKKLTNYYTGKNGDLAGEIEPGGTVIMAIQ